MKKQKYSIVSRNNIDKDERVFETFRTKKEVESTFRGIIKGYQKYTSFYATMVREGYALITDASGYEKEIWITRNF